MKNGKITSIITLLLSLMMVAALLLAGCGPAEETPTATDTPTVTATPTETATPEPSPYYSMTLGGRGDDRAVDLKPTTDGGHIIAGYTDSFGSGSFDVYLVKLDGDDEVVWAKPFGGEDADYANTVIQTGDGGYLLVGLTKSSGAGKYDVYIVKTDASGTLEWEKAYGGAGDDRAFSACEAGDGGFIVAGYTDSQGAGEDDVYLIKTDAAGELVWEKTFGGDEDDRANFVTPSPDGSYMVLGYTVSFAEGKEFSADIYLLKVDDAGNEEWARTYGTTDTDYGYWMEFTSDGGYVIGGYNVTYQVGARDFYIVKADADGKVEFDKSFDRTGSESYDRASSILATADGGYLLAGHTETYGDTDSDVWLLKTDAAGEMAWEKTYGGNDKDRVYRLQPDGDGGYIMAGYTDSYGAGGSDIYIIRTDADGNTEAVEPEVLAVEPQSPLPPGVSAGSAPDSHAEPGYTCRGMCHHETGVKPNPPGHESLLFTECTTCHTIPETAAAPTGEAGDLFVELVSVTQPIYADTEITVEIKTVPGATCTVWNILPKTGTISSKPVDREKVAGDDGVITWTWQLHRHTGAGEATLKFVVVKDDNTLEQTFPYTVSPP